MLIGEYIKRQDAADDPDAALRRFRYPRSYAAVSTRTAFVLYSVASLFVPFLTGVKHPVFIGFLVLSDMACLAYAFGSKTTLYADRLEYQSLFFFKRTVWRRQMHGWQLHLEYVKSSQIFFLVLKSTARDLTIEIDFRMNAPFYAWFPQLETLVQDMQLQFPGLQDIAA